MESSVSSEDKHKPGQQASSELRSDGHKQKDTDKAEGNNFHFLLF